MTHAYSLNTCPNRLLANRWSLAAVPGTFVTSQNLLAFQTHEVVQLLPRCHGCTSAGEIGLSACADPAISSR